MVQFESVGEVSRNAAMSAVANTMNENNANILGISSEMGGKRTVEVNSKLFITDRFDDWEVNKLEDAVGATGVVDTDSVRELVCTLFGLDNDAIGGFQNVTGFDPATDLTLASATGKTIDPAVTNITKPVVILDKNGPFEGVNSVVSVEIYYTDEAGNQCMIGAELDNDGAITAFSPQQAGMPGLPLGTTCTYTQTETQGLLESWGIDDAEDLQPGDLFLIQQKLQIIKDLISAVHSTGKTQGDVMREATQKFAQG
ncbi:MAG: hypothetical protein A2Y40_09820 [Candidatus Margulisbacteria bacterium GWF2_35_9]|nr:MAG: hypothetical protein A2Y40_09820 [Candidatus Margulisbacteria bacterium GWF2_35_9]